MRSTGETAAVRRRGEDSPTIAELVVRRRRGCIRARARRYEHNSGPFLRCLRANHRWFVVRLPPSLGCRPRRVPTFSGGWYGTRQPKGGGGLVPPGREKERKKENRHAKRETRDGTRTGSPPARAGFWKDDQGDRRGSPAPDKGHDRLAEPFVDRLGMKILFVCSHLTAFSLDR